MRVRILHSLCHDERTVSDIVRETGASQTNVSRHLNFMYRAGVLRRRKDGNFTWYSVSDSTLTELCRTVCVHIAARREHGEVTQLVDVADALTRRGADRRADGDAGPRAPG
jgi:DNA-binding transcriptional ArsR family regulator